MSIFGAMRTSVSGMNAQSNRLSVISENIANSATTGFKSAEAQFETVLDNGRSASDFSSGGVRSRVHYAIANQGLVQSTTTATNLAIQGQGFFVAADGNGAPRLTRAGAFTPDASGSLVNSAGFRLMGVDLSSGNTSAAGNGFGSLSLIKVDAGGLIAMPSSKGAFSANLPSAADAVPAAALPSTNAAGARFTDKTSLIAYDNLGGKVTLDLYLTKTGPNAWEAAIYDQAGAASGGGFPYASGPLGTTTLNFDPANGKLAGAASLSAPVPGGRTLALDLGGTTQLASDFAVRASSTDGNAPSAFKEIAVGEDGTVSAVYQNGATIARYRIALANVPSPDNLTPLNGNVYDVNPQSGGVIVGAPGAGPLGSIVASALEGSTVDIASELTTMIETQRSYTANSKAFQIGTDMADVLVNLKV